MTAATRSGTPFPALARVTGRGAAGSGTVKLTGTIPAVTDALPADVLLVPADGVPSALYLVEATAPGVHRTPRVSLDMTRQLCDITLDGAPARQVAVGAAAEAAVSAGLAAGAGILAAEQLGLAQRCLDLTVAYAKERRQFARQIGSFQAIKHRLADLWTTVALARAASRYAAACLADDDPDAPVAVALAKSACCEAAVSAAQECVQLHGGIGFTWEHPAHLYLKRAKAASVAYGTPGAHRAALADLVNLPSPEPSGPGSPGPLGAPWPARLRSARSASPVRCVGIAGRPAADPGWAAPGADCAGMSTRVGVSASWEGPSRAGSSVAWPAPRLAGLADRLLGDLRSLLARHASPGPRAGVRGPGRRPGTAARPHLAPVGEKDRHQPEREHAHRHDDDRPGSAGRRRRACCLDHS